MTIVESKLLHRVEDYINAGVKRDLIERRIDILRKHISNIKEGKEKGSLGKYRKEVVMLLDEQAKIGEKVSSSRVIYLSMLSNSEMDSIKEVYSSLLDRRNEVIKCVSLLENEEHNESEETLFECKHRLSYYNAIINFISSQYGIALPSDFIKKLKS